MRKLLLSAAVGAALAMPAVAHDFSAELARFAAIAATRDIGSEGAIAARIASERAQAELEQAEVRLLVQVRSLTNQALQLAGAQPAFLTSEIRRLEAAAATGTREPAIQARLDALLVQVRIAKAAYDALDKSSSERMQEALRLIEAAPARR